MQEPEIMFYSMRHPRQSGSKAHTIFFFLWLFHSKTKRIGGNKKVKNTTGLAKNSINQSVSIVFNTYISETSVPLPFTSLKEFNEKYTTLRNTTKSETGVVEIVKQDVANFLPYPKQKLCPKFSLLDIR